MQDKLSKVTVSKFDVHYYVVYSEGIASCINRCMNGSSFLCIPLGSRPDRSPQRVYGITEGYDDYDVVHARR